MNDVHPLVIDAARLLLEGDIEKAMEMIAEFFHRAAGYETDSTVVALLENCRDSARDISFEWYASHK